MREKILMHDMQYAECLCVYVKSVPFDAKMSVTSINLVKENHAADVSIPFLF